MLAQLHHQGVAGFAQQAISQVGRRASRNDLVSTIEPSVAVDEFLGRPALHQRSTASRRMSSSPFGFKPPWSTRSISRPCTSSITYLKFHKPELTTATHGASMCQITSNS